MQLLKIEMWCIRKSKSLNASSVVVLMNEWQKKGRKFLLAVN